MAKLIATFPCDGQLPIVTPNCTLSARVAGTITSIMPAFGQLENVSALMKRDLGVSFPVPGRALGKDGGRAIWSGPEQCFWLADEPPTELANAGMTDQSDGWVILRLEGASSEKVLARLMPIDLRRTKFRRGHSARTLLGHMGVSITRVKENTFDIMVFRSMTETAVHELAEAMNNIAARARTK